MNSYLGRYGSVGARAGIGLGAAAFVAFSLGCMNLSFGGRTEVLPPAVKEQEVSAEGIQRGKAFAGYAQEVCVYYPVPYVSPPNLEFEDQDSRRQVQIVDQKADHFRIKNTHLAVEIPWKARGVLATNVRPSVPAGANLASPASAPSP